MRRVLTFDTCTVYDVLLPKSHFRRQSSPGPLSALIQAIIPSKGYFRAAKSVCDEFGALLILDEVMCGMGPAYYNLREPSLS
ncbi:hypothetical protein B0H13DRAFT_1663488 [Mycena leptocephala]|nr:hypothetical protein B0H13DRAFT_1663488 [Mycena leptocephala]